MGSLENNQSSMKEMEDDEHEVDESQGTEGGIDEMADESGKESAHDSSSHGGSSPPGELFNDSMTLVHLSPEAEDTDTDRASEEDLDSEDGNTNRSEHDEGGGGGAEEALSDSSGEARRAETSETTGYGEGHLASDKASPSSSPSSPSPSEGPPPPAKLKVTMSFMQAYKIMRGPRDVEPSPLFACLRSRGGNGNGNGSDDVDDPFRLAGRDEVKLLNEVNDEIVRDSDDESLGEITRSSGGAARQDFFFFEAPEVTTLPYDSDDSDLEDGDYCFDHDRLDKGWIQANMLTDSDDDNDNDSDRSTDAYVSDGEGDPRDARITPAIFRALAAGCTLDDVGRLRDAKIDTGEQGRPRTPLDKIISVSADTSHLNPVLPHCRRRQFDIETGLELSPAYRTAQGPAPISAARTPPGVTPQRAGNLLLLLEQNQGQQYHPTRPGPAMPYLFEKMAPDVFRSLREQLYGRDCKANKPLPELSSPEPPEPPGPARFAWDDVNNAVNGCRFDHATVSLVQQSPAPRGKTKPAQLADTAQALLQTFHAQWRTIQACHAAEDRLALANERIQAALTIQARRLAVLEHQATVLRHKKAEQERAEAEAHYQKVQLVEQQRIKEEAKKRHVIKAVNDELHSLDMSKTEMEARVARGRELQVVLGQRLRDGDARLARLCWEHGAEDASMLSRILSAKLAALDAK